jgi:phage terminase large subunit GpA-like protein
VDATSGLGNWRAEITSYLKGIIMNSLSPSSPGEKLVFMKGAQIGGTQIGSW